MHLDPGTVSRYLNGTVVAPAEFVDTVRVEAARALLEGGADSVELIAERVGLGSSETLRRLFLCALSVTPTAYRARFRTSQR